MKCPNDTVPVFKENTHIGQWQFAISLTYSPVCYRFGRVDYIALMGMNNLTVFMLLVSCTLYLSEFTYHKKKYLRSIAMI
jgi:hypothetical protein